MVAFPSDSFPRRVVVTGLGAVSPFGLGVPAYWEALRQGQSGLGPVTLFDASHLSCRVVAEVPDFDPGDWVARRDRGRLSRMIPMAFVAAREALESAGLSNGGLSEEDSLNTGVIVGTGGGGIDFAEKQYESYFLKNGRGASSFAISSSFAGTLSSEISIDLGLEGPSHVLSTGCTASTDAIGYAFNSIRFGQADCLVTGGADACITPGLLASFCMMRVVSTGFNDDPTRASRPFTLDRDGFVLGEGAWMLVLEEAERARRRGATILAEVAGYGSTCDAYHRVRIRPDATGPARAMEKAVANAGLPLDAIQYVNLHGTSTPLNDRLETKAVKLTFGPHAKKLAMSATKSMIGHPQGACGAAGVAATVLALREGFLPPTVNLDNHDPECDLDYIPNHGRQAEVEAALCNCIAFGSKNSALVLRAANGTD